MSPKSSKKSRTSKPYKRVLVMLGVRKPNKNVIDEAVRLSDQLGAKLCAIQINLPGAGKPTMMMEPLPRIQEKDVRDAFRRHGHKDVAKEMGVRIDEGASLAQVIRRETKRADLLVIGHKQRNRLLAALRVASIDKQLVDLSDCPLVVVPA